MPFPGSVYSGTLRNYSQTTDRSTDHWPDSTEVCWRSKKQPNKPEMYQDISPHSHPGTVGLAHEDFSALHFWCGHHKSLLGHSGLGTGLCWGPLCPSYPCRAWYWCFELVSHSCPPRAACILQPWCPQLLHTFSLIQRRVFLFFPILLSKEEKERKEIPYSSTLQRQCLPGTSHQCFNPVFLHVLNFRNHMFSCGKHTQ